MIFKLIQTWLFLVLLIVSSCLYGQKEDHVWMFGSAINDFPDDTTTGGVSLDFNFEPPRVIYQRNMTGDIGETSTSLCDANGKMILYSNGMAVYDSTHQIMNNGDSVSFDNNWNNFYFEDIDWRRGRNVQDLMLALPTSEHVYLIYETVDNDLELTDNLRYSKIEFNSIPRGSIVDKDSLFHSYNYYNYGQLKSIKHGNGRDWWILKSSDNNMLFFKFLLDDNEIKLHSTDTINVNTSENSVGQSSISLDGTKVAYHSLDSLNTENDLTKLTMFDFDRVTGKLKHTFVDTSNIGHSFFSNGCCFSPDGTKLYISNSLSLYQYDLESNDILSSKVLIDSIGVQGSERGIGALKLGPDHKIYCSHAAAGSQLMGVIHDPNKKGTDCNFNMHSITIPVFYVRTMPNIPNFRLGPVDDSIADSLGLDNNPVSKFRCTQDTNNYLDISFTDLSYFRPEVWAWDFGDGITSDNQNPRHVYSEKGVYEVCLTVSNENSEDTFCKTLELGTSSSTDIELDFIIELYPNPVSEILLVNMQDYFPKSANIYFYDINGLVLSKEKLIYGWNSIDVSTYPAGAIIYSIEEEGKILKSGKIMKL